jgi:membrane protein insertase Oxa1/YidC/SpoIIIJ
MMMIMMTGMFAIFAFMYSSAFSIYMIMSNVLSLASTLIINKVVDVRARKQEERALQEKYNRRFPNQQNDKTKNKNKKK